MKYALKLHPSAMVARTEGYFVRGKDPSLLSRFLGPDLQEMPRIFSVGAGYLIVGAKSTKALGGKFIPLQCLAGRLFFPVHARLLPALLPDEIEGIAKGAGLLLLPHFSAMSFDLTRPLALDEWIEVPTRAQGGWKPFPKRPQTAKELTRIERPSPPMMAIVDMLGGAPDQAKPLSFGKDGQGAVPEDARPPGASTWETVKAQMNLRGGQLLGWIGKLARMPGLSDLGAQMAKKALESVPRISEKLLGSQEAALREVLRQLRSGDVEKGLRRAPIAVSDPNSGPGRVGTGSRLSEQNPFYSLGKLLGGSGAQTIAWLGGGNVWNDLASEYRKLAQEAMQRGDFRRAAYLYGFLLNDLGNAASALIAGGMFRDAAMIYRDKLNNPMLAASTFEKAGDWDEAIRLYVEQRKFEMAGILFERLGEEEQARDMFIRQADLHAEADQYLTAGDLIVKKIGDQERARSYYAKGWEINGVETRMCGLRLLDQSAAAKDWTAFHRLTAEAQARREAIGYEEMCRVLNHALSLSQESFSGRRDQELKDQTKLFFGAIVQDETKLSKKRGESAAGTVFNLGQSWPAAVYRDASGSVFNLGKNWSAAVYRDAVFASQALASGALKKQAERADHPVQALLKGPVRFAIISRQSRDLVVASDSQILVWRPDQGTTHAVVHHASYGRTIGIAADPNATKIYVLTALEMAAITSTPSEDVDLDNAATEEAIVKYFLQLFVLRSGSAFQLATSVEIDSAGGTPWLQSETEAGDPSLNPESPSGKWAEIIHVDNVQERFQLSAFDLLQKRTVPKPGKGESFYSANANAGSYWSWDRFTVTYCETIKGRMQAQEWSPGWFSYWEAPQAGRGMRFDWIFPDAKQLDLAWVDLATNLHWSSFAVQKLGKAHSSHRIHSGERAYRAVCLLGPNKMAALTDHGEIQWLKMTEAGKFVPFAPAERPATESPLAHLFGRGHANELIALDEKGTARRMRIP